MAGGSQAEGTGAWLRLFRAAVTRETGRAQAPPPPVQAVALGSSPRAPAVPKRPGSFLGTFLPRGRWKN